MDNLSTRDKIVGPIVSLVRRFPGCVYLVKYFVFLLHTRTLLLRMVKFTVLISICTHFVACLWYILGCRAGTCHGGTWADTASLVDTTADDADHYLNSLYWSMATMTTTGLFIILSMQRFFCVELLFHL